MNDYQLILTGTDGTGADATQRISSLSWSGSIKQTARQLEADLVTPNDGSLPELPCANGTQALLKVSGQARFTGTLVTREKATDSALTTVTALDRGLFLANNEGWYSFRGTTPEAAVRTICAAYGIPVGTLAATGMAVSRKYPGVALSKILDSLYTLAAEQNGKRYLVRFNGAGKLEAVEKPQTAALEIAPGKNLQTLRVTEDISAMQNSVAIYTEAGKLVRTVDDAESVALYGQLQHILTQRDGSDAGAEAQAWLEDNGQQQTMTVECLGDPALISGNAVILRANATGAAGLCWIDSDTHTWKNGQYFCRLTLNFRNLMHETIAGREV